MKPFIRVVYSAGSARRGNQIPTDFVSNITDTSTNFLGRSIIQEVTCLASKRARCKAAAVHYFVRTSMSEGRRAIPRARRPSVDFKGLLVA